MMRRVATVLLCSTISVFGQAKAPSLYADNTNPLVRLGVTRVLAGAEYPSWLLYPGITADVRQTIADMYSGRAFLESLDKSSEEVQKYNDAGQLIFDLLSAYGGKGASLREVPSKREQIAELKHNITPQLIKPRDGFQNDAPSDNETAYGGPSGAQIRSFDLAIAAMIRQYSIPVGYAPPADRSFAAWYQQQCESAFVNVATGVFRSLDCDRRRERPSAGRSWRGNIWGDTHILSLDGQAYDFQAVGEFIALKSTLDSLEVQVRQAPYGESRTASVITAVAMNIEGDHVGIYLATPLSLRVNGAQARLDRDLLLLPHGGRIEIGQNTFFLQWPDLTVLRVDVNDRYLSIYLDPADERHSRLRGLFGNYDGQNSNDVISRQGNLLTSEDVSRTNQLNRRLYSVFGNSWRINQAESLFDYPAGKGTRSFTDLSFPDSATDLDAAKRRAAESKCRDAGLSREPFLSACIFDVGLTGDVSFAKASIQAGSAGTINVLSATYGKACGVPVGNDTRNLAAQCDGKSQCTYVVSNARSGGDPSFGCAKDYVASYRCAGSPEIRMLSHGPIVSETYSVNLSCGRQSNDPIEFGSIIASGSGLARAPGSGKQSYTAVPIDVRAYGQGELHLEVTVGTGPATLSFDLYPGNVTLPTEGYPTQHGALTSAWSLRPGGRGEMTYRFSRGQILQFAVSGDWGSQVGTTNTFTYKAWVTH